MSRSGRGGGSVAYQYLSGSGTSGKLGRRLFIAGHSALTEQDYRQAFEQHGTIVDFYMAQKNDSRSNDTRATVYVTYSKISQAALAIEQLNGQPIGAAQKTIKVLVAHEKNGERLSEGEQNEHYHRLFIMMKPGQTQENINEIFGEYGRITELTHVKNKNLCFITYASRYSAALALEGVDEIYRPVFAAPRHNSRRGQGHGDYDDDYTAGGKRRRRDDDYPNYPMPFSGTHQLGLSASHSRVSPELTTVHVTVHQSAFEKNLRRLFDIIPGMLSMKYTGSDVPEFAASAIVHYASPEYADYAEDKLDSFEYPTGHCLIVRHVDDDIDGLSPSVDPLSRAAQVLVDAGIDPTSVLASNAKSNLSSVDEEKVPYADFKIPKRRTQLPITADVAKRLFFVCQPNIIGQSLLKDLFCRFGDMISCVMIKDRNIGYVRYASIESADTARDTLHLKTIRGARLKVMDAEDPRSDNKRRSEFNQIPTKDDQLSDINDTGGAYSAYKSFESTFSE